MRGYVYAESIKGVKLHTFSTCMKLRNAKKTVDVRKCFQSYRGRPRLQRTYVESDNALYLVVGYRNRRAQSPLAASGLENFTDSNVMTEWSGEIAILGICTQTLEPLEKPKEKKECESAIRA